MPSGNAILQVQLIPDRMFSKAIYAIKHRETRSSQKLNEYTKTKVNSEY